MFGDNELLNWTTLKHRTRTGLLTDRPTPFEVVLLLLLEVHNKSFDMSGELVAIHLFQMNFMSDMLLIV
jgi:hypothetical protein